MTPAQRHDENPERHAGRSQGRNERRENFDTRDSSAAGKYFRRAMLALGAYQVDATSERIRDGQARARGRDAASAGPPP